MKQLLNFFYFFEFTSFIYVNRVGQQPKMFRIKLQPAKRAHTDNGFIGMGIRLLSGVIWPVNNRRNFFRPSGFVWATCKIYLHVFLCCFKVDQSYIIFPDRVLPPTRYSSLKLRLVTKVRRNLKTSKHTLKISF